MRRGLVIALAVLGAACGPSAPEGDGDGSSAGSGDPVEPTTSTTDEPISTTSDATTEGPEDVCVPMLVPGVDPFATEATCDAYYGYDDVDAPLVAVTIVNLRDTVIAVPSPVGPRTDARYFAVSGTMGERRFEGSEAACEFTGELCAYWSADPPGPCSLIGLPPHPRIVLAPGGRFEHAWSPTLVAEVALPSDCYGSDDDEVLCDAVVPIAPGTFEMRAEAAELPDVPDGCQCMPDASGSCEAAAFDCEVTPSLVATATYDGVCDRIELVFD